jgi:AcrR family transcriptional regulator
MAIIETSEPRLPRRERERLARRQEILDAARVVFARRGFNDAKLEDVAERAEYGKGTLYNYFSSKEVLFASVIEDSFETMKSIAEEALNAEIPFTEKIDQFIAGELHYFFHNPESMHLMMREAHHLRGTNPMMQLLPQLLSMLAEEIADEQKKGGVIAEAEPMDLATILINLLYGHFTARVYRRICEVQQQTTEQNENADYCNVVEIFSGMTPQDIQREITSATILIHTVYFNGVHSSP